jgi:hypothetical protein
MKKQLSLFVMFAALSASCLRAQTNPTPWSLDGGGNFSCNEFSATTTSYPAGMVIHQMNTNPVTLSSAPASNVTLPCSAVQANATNVWGLENGGIGIRNNSTVATTGYTAGRLGEVVVAVNTTARTDVKVSFLAGCAAPAGSAAPVFRLRCQYRIGSSGSWSELPGGPVEYQPVNALDSVNMGPYALPASADNQAVVQVRWVYYYVSGSWTSNTRTHRVRLDDISITSKPIVSLPAYAMTCPTGSAFTLNTGTPAGGTYSGTGVSGSTFTPASAGAGSHTITYNYTDAHGISNSASQTITLDYDACTTQLQTNVCGKGGYDLSNAILCDPVTPVQDYEWEFTNTTTGAVYTKVKGNNYQSMALWAVPGLQYGATYSVRVRARILNQWRGWGPACTIGMQATIPVTQLNTASCGATALTLNDAIYSTAVWGASNYQFEFSNSSGFYTLYTKNNSTPNCVLWTVPGLQYGQSYDVRVRSCVGGSWSAFGSVCSVSMQGAAPVTQLTSASCGATGLTLNDGIYAAAISGASSYQFEFTNSGGFSAVYTKNNNTPSCALWVVQGLQYGQSYNVRVRALVGGSWSAYGAACTISLQSSIPATQLSSASCGATALTTSGTIYCDAVAAASNTQWEFSNGSGFYTVYTRNNTAANCWLGAITGLASGNTYDVRVRSYVNGVWSAWGSSCSISLGSAARMAAATLVQPEIAAGVQVIPNPVVDGVAPELLISGASGKTVQMEVMDIGGKVYSSQTLWIDSAEFRLGLPDRSMLAPGIYLVVMKTDADVKVTRFAVQ